METTEYRDVTLGILIMVLALFPLYVAWYATDFINIQRFVIDFICILIYNRLWLVGYMFVMGFKVHNV